MAFTSDLTIDEVLLVEEAGFEPLDLVMGASYFHLGMSFAGWSQNAEVTVLSNAIMAARNEAMHALDAQARACGADGVVAVRLEVEAKHHEAEFVAMGTAVKRRGGDGAAFRTSNGGPFTCALSGEDFWALVRGGVRPVCLAMGACVYHVAHLGLRAWLQQTTQNVEHEPFTTALYAARELAMERMQREAIAAGASGVLDVKVEEGRYGWDSHVIEMLAIGTAVAPMPGATSTVPRVETVIGV